MAKRPAKRLLVVPQRRQALERLVLHATSLRIPVVEVEGGSLTAVAGFDGHQGIALVVEPRVFAGLDDVLARAVERGEPPFILVLDSLEDPQNVGTLLRSAEAAGVHGVLFPTHRQAPLSPAAIKASAGAVEHLLLCPVDDLAAALSDLRIRGLRVAAAEADAPLTTAQADLRGPLAIVVGSEGQGVSPLIRRRADVAVRIPMRGAIGSLNAAVAGSILLFAAVAQRDPAGEGSAIRPRPATFDELVDATAAGVEPRNTDAATGSAEPPARKRRKGLSTEVPAASSTGGTDGTDGRTEPDAELPTESLAGNHEEPPTETPPMKAARAGRARTTTGPAAGAKAQPAAAKPRKSALDDAAAQATEPATQDTATVAKRKPAATRAKVATAPKPSAAEVKPKAKRAPRAAATSKGRPPAAEDATTSAEDSGADDLLPGGPPPE